VITLEEDIREGRPLLHAVMRDGRRLYPPPPLSEIRAYAAQELETLQQELRALGNDPPYPISISEPLQRLADDIDTLNRMS